MAVRSKSFTQYWIECDGCGVSECCPDGDSENVRNKYQAVKWAGMHKVKNGDVLCDTCYEKLKKNRRTRDV